MADPSGSIFKLFRTVDPSTVNVQIKEKFAKLTLSSNKKKEQKEHKEQRTQELDTHKSSSTASRQLLNELNSVNRESEESLPQRSHSSTSSSAAMVVQHTPKASEDDHSQLDASDYMEVLQLSADGCTQQQTQDVDVDVEGLSVQVSNLTMEAQPKQRMPEISICISSTTEEETESGEELCITISDSSVSDNEPEVSAREESSAREQDAPMSINEQLNPVVALTSDKVQRIQAFLRDVSFERHEMIRRGIADETGHIRNSRLESADTESMSQDVDSTHMDSPPCTPSRIWCEPSNNQEREPSKRVADDESEANTEQDSSRRLADDETEANTVCSSEKTEQDSSKRLADNETEANTVCSSEPVERESSRRLADNETEVNTPDLEATLTDADPNESVFIPETSCEAELEPSPVRPSSASSTETAEDVLCTPVVQVSSINISAKINIKINIPSMDSSSAESDPPDADETRESPQQEDNEEQDEHQAQEKEQHQHEDKSNSLLVDDNSQDKGFLTNAEKLLNELYGKSWQTPDIIRTLKRTGSKGSSAAPATPEAGTFRTPLTEVRRQPRARQQAATTAKKRAPRPPPSTSNESALGDFSLCE